MYAVNFTEILATGVNTSNPDWPIQSCQNGWEFDMEEVPYSTIATEVKVIFVYILSFQVLIEVFYFQLEWVCDNAALPTIAQSIFFLGAIVGGLIFGWIADRFGRIPSLVGCNMIGFIAGVATAFVGGFWQFSLCRFLVGFAFDNCFTMMYILGKFILLNFFFKKKVSLKV